MRRERRERMVPVPCGPSRYRYRRSPKTFGFQNGFRPWRAAISSSIRSGYGATPCNGHGIAAWISWALLWATGGVLSRYGMPEEFCGALRELMERTPELERLKAIWARNAGTVTHLRQAWPELRTVNGTRRIHV